MTDKIFDSVNIEMDIIEISLIRLHIILHVLTPIDYATRAKVVKEAEKKGKKEKKKAKKLKKSKSSDSDQKVSHQKVSDHEILDQAIAENSKRLKFDEDKRVDNGRDDLFNCLGRAFENERNAQIIMRCLSEEKLTDKKYNDLAWGRICENFAQKFMYHSKTTEDDIGKDFYQTVLKKHVGDLMLQRGKTFIDSGVFKKYHPGENPITMVCVQKTITEDLLPTVEAYIPLNQLIDYGLMFKDVKTYNPLKTVKGFENATPLFYGMFHSFGIEFNLAAAFFLSEEGAFGYRWAIYDRFENGKLN